VKCIRREGEIWGRGTRVVSVFQFPVLDTPAFSSSSLSPSTPGHVTLRHRRTRHTKERRELVRSGEMSMSRINRGAPQRPEWRGSLQARGPRDLRSRELVALPTCSRRRFLSLSAYPCPTLHGCMRRPLSLPSQSDLSHWRSATWG
jgi:hypothetical protein